MRRSTYSFLAFIFISSMAISQVGYNKIQISNLDQNLQPTYPETPSETSFSYHGNRSESCWSPLSSDYVNITNSMWGLPGTWAEANPGDDGSFGPINLGWTYYFYGQAFTSIYINVNGNITFGDPYSAYSAYGFPASNVPAMIAPYWGDVDLRATGAGANQLYYKLDSNKITIQWIEVGYYSMNTDKTNSFQLVLTDGNDVGIGVGYNTVFSYDDMNWCVGDASGGTSGFGGPSDYGTVGAQSDGGSYYYQIGLFGLDNSDYDGAGGNLDGIHYLDGRCFTMDLSGLNVPPIANNLPNSRKVNLCPGMSFELETSFSAPEVNQETYTTIVNSSLSDLSYVTADGNLSEQTLTINVQEADTGLHYVIYQSTDNGSIPETTIDTLIVEVFSCSPNPVPRSIEFDGVDDYAEIPNHQAIQSSGGNTYTFWVRPEVQNYSGDVYILEKDNQFRMGINGTTEKVFFDGYVNGSWNSVLSNDAIPLNKWTAVSAVADGQSISLYVNGEISNTASVSGLPSTSSASLIVGGDPGTNEHFKGRIDEISIWSRSLTSSEIQEHIWEACEVHHDYLRTYFKCSESSVLYNDNDSQSGLSFPNGTLVNMDVNTCWKQNYASVWKGEYNSDFNEFKNWTSELVPDPTGTGSLLPVEYVIIKQPDDLNYPLVLDQTIEVNSIVFLDSNNVTFSSTGNLRINNDLITFQSPNYTSGQVDFIGTSGQNIKGTNDFYNILTDDDITLQSDQNIIGDLTLNTGVLDVNGYNLKVVSNAAGTGEIYHNSGSISGDVIIERFLPYDENAIGWRYLSSPIQNATYAQLNDDITLMGFGNWPWEDPWPNVFVYNESVTTPGRINGWIAPAGLNTSIGDMEGFILHTPYNGLTVDFVGEVNTGTLGRNIYNTPSGIADEDGWNLISNPYPSMIDWDLATLPSGVENAVYVYNYKSDRYSSYIDGLGTNGGSNKIATGQSFFIKTNNDAYLEFDNTIRTLGNNGEGFRSQDSQSETYTVNFAKADDIDELVINFDDDATPEFDPSKDAYKLGTYENIHQISSAVNEKNLSIDSRPATTTLQSIQLELNGGDPGMHSIFISTKSDNDGRQINLQDFKENTITNLNNVHVYEFNYNPDEDQNRFVLHFGDLLNDIHTNVEQKFIITQDENQLMIMNLYQDVYFEIFDLSGKRILMDELFNGDNTVTTTELTTGCYLMRIFSNDKSPYTHKFVIR